MMHILIFYGGLIAWFSRMVIGTGNISLYTTVFTRRKKSKDTNRIFFVAGTEGVGHHAFYAMLEHCVVISKVCSPMHTLHGTIRKATLATDIHRLGGALRNVHKTISDIANESSNDTKFSSKLHYVGLLRNEMLSYPHLGGIEQYLHNPDVVSLSSFAEEVNFDLRVIVLLRNASNVIASVERRFGHHLQKLTNLIISASTLYLQLKSIDKQFIHCVEYEKLRDSASNYFHFMHPIFQYNNSYLVKQLTAQLRYKLPLVAVNPAVNGNCVHMNRGRQDFMDSSHIFSRKINSYMTYRLHVIFDNIRQEICQENHVQKQQDNVHTPYNDRQSKLRKDSVNLHGCELNTTISTTEEQTAVEHNNRTALLREKDYKVKKSTFDDTSRLLFLVGIEGSGVHEQFDIMLKYCIVELKACEAVEAMSEAMRKIAFPSDRGAFEQALLQLRNVTKSRSTLQQQQQATQSRATDKIKSKVDSFPEHPRHRLPPVGYIGTVVVGNENNNNNNSGDKPFLSYPYSDKKHGKRSPDLVPLALYSEEFNLDLRIVVVLKNAAQIVSVVGRKYGLFKKELLNLLSSVTTLYVQLKCIDRAFIYCIKDEKELVSSASDYWGFIHPIFVGKVHSHPHHYHHNMHQQQQHKHHQQEKEEAGLLAHLLASQLQQLQPYQHHLVKDEETTIQQRSKNPATKIDQSHVNPDHDDVATTVQPYSSMESVMSSATPGVAYIVYRLQIVIDLIQREVC